MKFLDLPSDVIKKCSTFLQMKDLLRLNRCCRLIHHLCKDPCVFKQRKNDKLVLNPINVHDMIVNEADLSKFDKGNVADLDLLDLRFEQSVMQPVIPAIESIMMAAQYVRTNVSLVNCLPIYSLFEKTSVCNNLCIYVDAVDEIYAQDLKKWLSKNNEPQKEFKIFELKSGQYRDDDWVFRLIRKCPSKNLILSGWDDLELTDDNKLELLFGHSVKHLELRHCNLSCDRNLLGKSVFQGKGIEKFTLVLDDTIDFDVMEYFLKLGPDYFFDLPTNLGFTYHLFGLGLFSKVKEFVIDVGLLRSTYIFERLFDNEDFQSLQQIILKFEDDPDFTRLEWWLEQLNDCKKNLKTQYTDLKTVLLCAEQTKPLEFLWSL